MTDTVISVENLSKKYVIGHQNQEGYTTLSDKITSSFKSMTNVFNPKQFKKDTTQEDFWALKDVSFEIKQGDRVGIIGRNGAGKSTLLKILSRITEPTSGKISIKGRVASLLEVGTGFHPELTGRENVFLNGAILGMDRVEIKKKFDEIVAFAEVEKFLDTPVKRYSSGMYVRLAFAVAAHLEPEILIVDEVLAVGDAAFQKKCLGKMEDVAEKEGRTVVFVSHNIRMVKVLCERGIYLNVGEVHSKGTIDNVAKIYEKELINIVSSTSLTKRNDRTGSGTIRAEYVCFSSDANNNLDIWRTGGESFVSIGYSCPNGKYLQNIEVALGILKLDETPLLYLGSKVTNEDIPKVTGTGEFKCRIEKLPLEPGEYLVNVEIKHNGIIADYVRGAAVLKVQEGDFYGTGKIWTYGSFLCTYSWSHDHDNF